MNGRYLLPPLRHLPPGRLDQRKQHLLSEIEQRRIGAHRRLTALPRRRRLVVAMATVVIVGALIATPALGLQNAILDLFGRSDVEFAQAPPAASVIKREFAEMTSGAPKGMNPNVLPGQTKLAATFNVEGGQRRVWVAPTAGGGYCYVIERLSGGCRQDGSPSAGLELGGSFVLAAGASAPRMDFLAGEIFEPRATTLRVTFEDGRTRLLPFVFVSEPIAAGFFVYRPTGLEQEPGHRPLSVVILDVKGSPLATREIDWVNEARKAEQARQLFRDRANQQRP